MDELIYQKLNAVTSELEAVTAEAPEDFSVNYEGYQGNIEKALLYFLDALFPSYSRYPEDPDWKESIRTHYLKKGCEHLTNALQKEMTEEKAEAAVMELVDRLPGVYRVLLTDILAGYEGDPAAKTVDEIILCYPAFIAIGTHRVAHELYQMGHPVVARLMSEYAHKKTGIDIHPGATIGKHFFIDHGTGVVIGETTVIGENVKLYQHVTLGAKSFPVNDDGTLVKGIKRHPNIGNNVVIYAGATILGGDVYIGDNCVIGGNVWLTHSVPEGLTVYQSGPSERVKENR